jgi:antibiotic biosynthesis monooxygenase (ABM) superfamily enzyme
MKPVGARAACGRVSALPEPVTVVITRRVKAGREAEYEAWLARLQAAARGVPGYLGVTTQRPAPGAAREYVSAVRFASLDDLRRYETTALHRDHLAEVAGLVEGDATWQALTGLEFWFTPPPGMAVPQPSRPRMVIAHDLGGVHAGAWASAASSMPQLRCCPGRCPRRCGCC